MMMYAYLIVLLIPYFSCAMHNVTDDTVLASNNSHVLETVRLLPTIIPVNNNSPRVVFASSWGEGNRQERRKKLTGIELKKRQEEVLAFNLNNKINKRIMNFYSPESDLGHAFDKMSAQKKYNALQTDFARSVKRLQDMDVLVKELKSVYGINELYRINSFFKATVNNIVHYMSPEKNKDAINGFTVDKFLAIEKKIKRNLSSRLACFIHDHVERVWDATVKSSSKNSHMIAFDAGMPLERTSFAISKNKQYLWAHSKGGEIIMWSLITGEKVTINSRTQTWNDITISSYWEPYTHNKAHIISFGYDIPSYARSYFNAGRFYVGLPVTKESLVCEVAYKNSLNDPAMLEALLKSAALKKMHPLMRKNITELVSERSWL